MNTASSKRQNKRKVGIKSMILLLAIVMGWMVDATFAAGENSELITNMSNLVNDFMKVASWIRIPIATLAGKFMSNDMIYGTRFHLDKYLWQMWNISKNFANFGILAFLLYEIIQYIITKQGSIQKTIGKAVISGIAIQMSWFFVGAIIDINTIATTAVGSFPASFLGDSQAGENMNNIIDSTIQKGTIILDEKGSAELKEGENTDSAKTIKEKLMPKYDSVAGPLIFIGASALNIQDMMTKKDGENTSAKSLLITFGLKGGILILYVITLLLLLIANIIRIGYLRVFIAISPILILMATFMKDEGIGSKGFTKNLSIANFISITFKPTIFVAVMGVILIFITTIQSVLLKDNPPEINGIKISTNQANSESRIEIAGVASISTIDHVFATAKGAGQSVIPNLIIYLATIFLLWILIRLSLGSGKDPIAGVMNKGVEFIEQSAKTIPIANGLGYEGLKNFSREGLKEIGKPMGFEDLGKRDSPNGGKRGKDENDAFEEKIRTMIGGKREWKEKEIEDLQKTIRNNGDFLLETKNILASEDHEILTSTSSIYPKWEKELLTWIGKEPRITNLSKKYSDMKDITSSDWKEIHNRLGGDPKNPPRDLNEFKNIQYGVK